MRKVIIHLSTEGHEPLRGMGGGGVYSILCGVGYFPLSSTNIMHSQYYKSIVKVDPAIKIIGLS